MLLTWGDVYVRSCVIFQDQIRLIPFDPNKEINILTDGANSKGIGFVFYQHTNLPITPATTTYTVHRPTRSIQQATGGY